MRKRAQDVAMMILLLASSGCVGVRRERIAKSWPEPANASNIKQFEGMFSNRCVDRGVGHPTDQTAQLFDFMTGEGHAHGKEGARVELRSSPDNNLLHVGLFDKEGAQIDSATLKCGRDFEFSGGFLSLHGPFSGSHAGSGNLGTGLERQSSRLYISTSDGLLGQRSECGVGLLFYFVPYAGTSKSWMLWPQVARQ